MLGWRGLLGLNAALDLSCTEYKQAQHPSYVAVSSHRVRRITGRNDLNLKSICIRLHTAVLTVDLDVFDRWIPQGGLWSAGLDPLPQTLISPDSGRGGI